MADGEPQPQLDASKVKQIRIKTGVVKRTAKEKLSYVKETEKQTQEVKKMEDDGKDEYDIRKRIQCRDESKNMVKVVGKQLIDRHRDLLDLKNEVDSDELIKETDEYKKMVELFEDQAVKDALAYEDY